MHDVTPNKSPEPTAVGAVRSAIAVHAASRRWLSFLGHMEAHRMILYPDGSEVRVGDAVSLHHRTYTGIVRHIIDSPAVIDAWNLEEAGLMIDTSYGGLVFHPKHSLTDDEIVFTSRAVA